MAAAGIMVIGIDGLILEMDAAFAALSGAPVAGLIGRSALHLCAAADHGRVAALFRAVMRRGMPAIGRARLVRSDGSQRPVRCRLAPLPDPSRLAVTAMLPAPALSGERLPPAALVRLARLLLACRHAARESFDGVISPDGSWDVLLAAFVQEAEGRVPTLASLLLLLDAPERIVRRWLAVLVGEGLLRVGGVGGTPDGEHLRLSPTARQRLELSLSRAASHTPVDG